MILPTIIAQLSADPTGDVVTWTLQMIKTIVEMFHSGQHGPAVAGILMLLVYFLRLLLKDRLPAAALPWLSAGLGILTAISMQLGALAVGARPGEWLSVILKGALAGATASGLWSLVGKKIVDLFKSIGKPKDTPPQAPPQDQTPA